MVLEDVYLWFSYRLISKGCACFLVFFIELPFTFMSTWEQIYFPLSCYVPITPAFLSATVCSLLGELQGRAAHAHTFLLWPAGYLDQKYN